LLALIATVSAAEFSWQKPHAQVLPTGDLEWAPEPFRFQAGRTVRYIDFEGGSDANDGASKATPWKHHPWDPNATGKAKASADTVATFVFKRGAVYRGALYVPAGLQGTAQEPIRLTSNSSWGAGEVVLCGSERVTGWTVGADHPDVPEPEKVWWVDLDFAPRNVWMVEPGGEVTRIQLARTPNWEVVNPDDIKSQWWTWKNPRKPFDNYTTLGGQKRHLAFDKEHINESMPQAYYKDAILWTTKGWVMGSPFPTRVRRVDRRRGALAFRGQWGGVSYKIIRGCRYYLEDKPHYLDAPGEFWFHKTGDGGRLYIRLPGDRDPNTARIEVAKRIHVIESDGTRHLHVNGLTFRFTNVYWDLTATPGWLTPAHKDVDAACVRVLGSGQDIRVSHCRFEHVHRAIRLKAAGRRDALDGVMVSDNVFRHTDHGAVEIAEGSHYGMVSPPIGRLYDVRVLRNKFEHIGLRPSRFGQGQALTVSFPETLEVAGNILERCYSAGINVFGGKASRAVTHRPLVRLLIHHNKVTDSLLNNDDFGGIETWQGGPAYVYNNISGNPGGYRNWDHVLNPRRENRFGHAYYLDGAFKNYHFNNIAWGKSKGPTGPLANTAAFQEIHSYQNTFFNNTVYNFVKGSRRQAPHAGRDKFLGNVWSSIGEWVFWHAKPARSIAEGNAHHAGPQKQTFALDTNAYARNIFHDVSDRFACFEPSGRWHGDLASFRTALQEHHALASDVGEVSQRPVLRDPAKRDLRLADDSAAIDRGVKVFVPWALHAVVGEWHFRRNRRDPTRVIDEHWYMTPYHVRRAEYYQRPTYPLKAVNVAAEDYVAGTLEDWTEGALRLNGADQYAVLSHAELTKPFQYEAKAKAGEGGWVTVTAPKAVAPGQRFTITLKAPGAAEGEKLGAHLHWSRKERWGGFNAWGGEAKDAQGGTPCTFAFTPKDRPGLDHFSLLIFLSPTGEWEDKTTSVTLDIAKADGPAELKMQTVTIGNGDGVSRRRVEGEALKNPRVHSSSFLVEVYFRTKPGHTAGPLVSHLGERGYELLVDLFGGASLAVRADGPEAIATQAKVNDGRWHHLIAEVDRTASVLRLYVDGKLDTEQRIELTGSLASEADLLVGRSAKGRHFAGDIEFLRIALGTLADAKTTIQELHAWQFDGPFLRDFTGRRSPDGRRDAGAIELRPE
jgi:hypothetical protein